MHMHKRGMKLGTSHFNSLNYESNIASNLRNNPKRFWTYVKSKTKVRYSIPTLKFLDNNEAITCVQIMKKL